MHYGGTSATALPGIVDIKERPVRKEYYKLTEPDHLNMVQLAAETRMPIDYIKNSSKRKNKSPKKRAPAFPSPKQHLKRANQWEDKFYVSVSQHNGAHHSS